MKMDSVSAVKVLLAIELLLPCDESENESGCGAITQRKKKKYWVHPYLKNRNETGAYESVFLTMKMTDPLLLKTYIRLSSNQFEELFSMVESLIQKQNVVRESVCPGMRLALTLRYLATGESQASLSITYKLGRTTMHNIIKETCKAIASVLRPKVFPKLNENTFRNIAIGFESRLNFPHCVGAIDGKHVEIQAPPNAGSVYFNYKKTQSIVLMAICDFKYEFIWYNIGGAGRQSDGGVFRHSILGQKFYEKKLSLPPSENISQNMLNIPYVFVADDAFSLHLNMLKPYAKSMLTLEQRIFNYRLSRARRMIENSFGILSARWRIFRTAINAHPELVEDVVETCVCLHNCLRQQNDSVTDLVDADNRSEMVSGSWRSLETNMFPLQRHNTNPPNIAKSLRNQFAHYFVNEGSVDWQLNKI